MPQSEPSKLNMLSVIEARKEERVLFIEGRPGEELVQKVIPVDIKEIHPGYVEMRSKATLEPGEYAIVDYGGRNQMPTAWSFAIEP